MRHLIVRENDPAPGISVATHCREYERGFRVSPHAHLSDQLVYASAGLMEVISGQSRWMIPPHFGLWIPARTLHEIHMPERVSMRTLYLRPSIAHLAPTCAVFHIGPLLRELIFEIVRIGQLRYRDRIECALRDLLVAELRRATPVPTVVVLPRDLRGVAVAQAVIDHPATRIPLKLLCASAGVSVRTLERLFLRETGTDFECWRRQVRLMKAIGLLVAGLSVKEAAFSVGYQQPSAFVALFRATFGTTPKAWISALQRGNEKTPPD
ncbi:MAG: helix-turn-helix transcriptional regulator [Terracidiphilus sp.]